MRKAVDESVTSELKGISVQLHQLCLAVTGESSLGDAVTKINRMKQCLVFSCHSLTVLIVLYFHTDLMAGFSKTLPFFLCFWGPVGNMGLLFA